MFHPHFPSTYRQTDVTLSRRGRLERRDFLKTIPAAAAAAGLLSWTDLVSLQASQLKARGKACILLWMNGGPSQFETWDPKPEHANGGETRSIATAVPGIHLANNLPETAKLMKDICLLRSLHSAEGSHPRATYLMHTGYVPTAAVKYPTLGSHVAQHLGDEASELPNFVRIGQSRSSGGAGLLGVDYDPFVVSDPNRVPDNTGLATSERRFKRRLGLMNQLDREYARRGAETEVADHQKLYQKTSRMVLSPKMDVFAVDEEPESVREAYGTSNFGSGCLLARRLIEEGVPFVEVTANGWDTHQDNFAETTKLCGQVDRPYAQLLADLKRRGLLESTLVIWMGEFGRTPRVNARAGRDHFPRAFSGALAGCGVRGGQVIGATEADGAAIRDRPIGVTDFFQTVCQALEIDADYENDAMGRPIRIVDGGEAVQEVFG